MGIQHWMHNPRNVKKNPHKFADGECKTIQEVVISRNQDRVEPTVFVFIGYEHEGMFLSKAEVRQFAKNDGLTIEEFREFFVPETMPAFRGRIIHFTDKLY